MVKDAKGNHAYLPSILGIGNVNGAKFDKMYINVQLSAIKTLVSKVTMAEVRHYNDEMEVSINLVLKCSGLPLPCQVV